MKKTLLMFLSADHLHAQLMSGGDIAQQRDFNNNPEGLENFSAFLQTANYPAYLLTDLIEEDFRQEIVPHLIGRSRNSLIQRKFDQFYRSTPFRKAIRLQRQKTGRRDDEMLFSALTNPSLILPWLNVMLAQQTLLAGIYSIPQISAPLVKSYPSDHLLLISWEKYSGLRQTYFSEHRLQISRLTPVHDELTFADSVTNELTRTYQYLKSLSLLPAGQILDVLILCHADDRDQLQQLLPHDADMRYDFADIKKIGKRLNISHRFTDSDASQIFLYQLAVDRPYTNYAAAEHTHYYTLWQLRRALNWSGGVILLASLLWTLVNVWQGDGDAAGAEALRMQARHLENEAQQITQSLPKTPAPIADMKSSVLIMRTLDQYEPIPQIILKPITVTLDRFPQIVPDSLSWQTNAAEPVAHNTKAEVPAQVIILKGEMQGFAYDYRAALAYLDRFQLELGARGYQVTVLTQPLNVSPSVNLADQHEDRKNELAFSLKLAWRPPT